MVILSPYTTLPANRLHDTQELALPPVNSKIYLSTVSTKQPPGRSWSRYKKLLIDTPKDSNLLQRQKLWNFQKVNRGAFRSQIASLPDIPYRVHTNTANKVSVGVQAGPNWRFNPTLRVLFPNLTSRVVRTLRDITGLEDGDEGGVHDDNDDDVSDDAHDKACSPMHLDDSDDYSSDFESDVDDPFYEFDSVVRKKDAGTMTDERKHTVKHAKKREKKKRGKDRQSRRELSSILVNTDRSKRSGSAQSRNVRFRQYDGVDEYTQTPDIPDVTPPMIERIEIETSRPIKGDTGNKQSPEPEVITPAPPLQSSPVPRLESLETENTDFLNVPFEIGNIGHSSHRSLESMSVLDYLSGARTDRARYADNKRNCNSDRRSDGHSKLDAGADRQWFQQIVGDKDIIDPSTYENFARVRPNVDNTSDSNTDRYMDVGKAGPARRGVGLTPRINGEPLVSRTQQYLAGLAAKQEATLSSSVPNKSKPSRKNVINVGKSY